MQPMAGLSERELARVRGRLVEFGVHHVEKWRLALEMIDELIGWGSSRRLGRACACGCQRPEPEPGMSDDRMKV